MARGLLGDYLLSHNFHLLDVDWSLNVPPFVLWPAASFSSISAPELTIETEEINEGTASFKHHVLKKGSVGSITMSRGATMFNSDFWRWTMACLKGTPSQSSIGSFATELAKAVGTAGLFGDFPVPGKRRNMALIHLSNMSAEGIRMAMDQGDVADRVRAMAALPAVAASPVSSIASLVGGSFGGAVESGSNMLNFGITSVPAKVWMLFDALPVRYKAASDFDASTSSVSIQELEVVCGRMEEFALLA